MLDFFEVKNYIVYPSPEVRLLEPFKTIWEKDTSEDKSKAMKSFSYIVLGNSPKKTNPFHKLELLERREAALKEVYEEGHTISELEKQGENRFIELLTKNSGSYLLFESAQKALVNLRTFLSTVDLTERTERGQPIYKPADITRAMKDLHDVTVKMELFRDKVVSDDYEVTRTKSNKKIGYFED